MTTVAKFLAGLCVVGLFAAAGLFGTEYLLSRAESAGSGGGSEPRATRVGVARPETRRIEEAVTAVGTISPVRRVDLRPAVSGRVNEVAVSSGARVEQGAPLVQLDDAAQRANLEGAEASLSEARQNLDRIEELAESNTAAEQRLETARAAFGRAESDVMAARAALRDRRIDAPFSGTLGFVDLDAGAYVSPQDVVAELSDLSVVRVDLSLPERYFGRIEEGQKIALTVPAYPDETFEGTVTVREPAIDAGSRSFDVRAEIDNAERRLVGGMFAQTRLVLDTYEGIAVPDDAIISEGAGSFVYAVSDGEAHRRDVSLGRSLGALTEVTGGIDEDARVVVSGWSTLRDGASVTVADDIAREGLR